MFGKRRALRALSATLIASGVISASALAAVDRLTPGVSIGPLRLGMTLSQAKRVLGRGYTVTERRTIAGVSYQELDWNFSTTSVGFLQRGRRLEAAQISTTLTHDRTPNGIGVGSTFKAVLRAFPSAACRAFYPTTAAAFRTHLAPPALVMTAKDGVRTALLLEPNKKLEYNGTWRVYQVIIRRAVKGWASFSLRGACTAGWQERGTPYRYP